MALCKCMRGEVGWRGELRGQERTGDGIGGRVEGDRKDREIKRDKTERDRHKNVEIYVIYEYR